MSGAEEHGHRDHDLRSGSPKPQQPPPRPHRARLPQHHRRRQLPHQVAQVGNSGEILNLCFHGIGTPRRELEVDEGLYWVEPAQFVELLDAVEQFPWVRITFDDGNASDAALALPELQRRKLTASFFVVGDRIDEPGSLSSRDIRSMISSGMTIGSHGMSHRPWRSCNEQDLRVELVDGARRIATVAGQPVSHVACPFGSYNRTVLTAIRGHGFTRVYTVDEGPAREDAWLQSRYAVRSDDTPRKLELMAQSPRGATLPAALRHGKSFVKRWR